jgi:hypothetical protein
VGGGQRSLPMRALFNPFRAGKPSRAGTSPAEYVWISEVDQPTSANSPAALARRAAKALGSVWIVIRSFYRISGRATNGKPDLRSSQYGGRRRAGSGCAFYCD